MISFKLFHGIRETLKVCVITGDLLMTIHCLLLLIGINLPIAEFICGLSLFGFIVIFISSYLLNFCNLYRCFLIHDFIVQCCIDYQRIFGFGELLIPMRFFMFISGVFLILWLMYRELILKSSCLVTS